MNISQHPVTLIEVSPKELHHDAPGGSALWIRIKGCKGNPEDPNNDIMQCRLEYYEGKIMFYLWDGEENNPMSFPIELRKDYKTALEANTKELPLLLNTKDPDVKKLVTERLKNEI